METTEKNIVELLERISHNDKKDRNNLFIGIGLLSFFISFVAFFAKGQIENAMKKNEIEVRSIEKQSDSIKAFTIEFLNAEKNEANILKYYSPILKRYYERAETPVGYIIKNRTKFIDEFPKSKFVFDKKDTEVQIQKDKTANVIANGIFYADSLKSKPENILYKIKVDLKTKKITSIVSYVSTPQIK